MELGEIFFGEVLELGDFGGGGFEIGELNAFLDFLDFGFGEGAADFYKIFFFFSEFRVGEAIGELAVVGKKKQSFGVFIEAADGVDGVFFGDKIEDSAAFLWIMAGG